MKIVKIIPCLLIAISAYGCGQEETKLSEQNEQVTISILAGQSTSDAGVEDMIDEKIAEVLPEVKLEWECVDWGEGFEPRLRARLASGDIPDIIIGKAQDVKTYYSTGSLAPIDKKLLQVIDENALETVTVGGNYYGIPVNVWYQGVIYHKPIFEKYGLEVPKTQEELLNIIQILKENNVTPFASHYLESWKIGNTTMQFMINEIFNQNPVWGDDFRAGKVNYQNNKVIEQCMENNKEILENSWDDALLIDQFTCDTRFEKQEAAMYLTGSWSLQFSNQYAGEGEYGIFPYPNLTGDAKLIRETNMTFMKSAATENGETVDKILKVLTQDKKLLEEILEFTQTYPVQEIEKYSFKSCIQNDVEEYEKNGEVIEAATGITQLIWPFQNEIASQEQLWLQGKKTLDNVLEYADEHREESIR